MPASPKPASTTVAEQQAELRDRLPFSDTRDFEDAARGLIAPLGGPVTDETGIEVTGDESAIGRLLAVLEPGDPDFAIVTP